MSEDPIKHVIVLMLENRSFDQMLGSLARELPGIDGVDERSPGINRDWDGREYRQAPLAGDRIDPDPKHERDHVLFQMEDGLGNFVRDYQRAYPDTTPEQ